MKLLTLKWRFLPFEFLMGIENELWSVKLVEALHFCECKKESVVMLSRFAVCCPFNFTWISSEWSFCPCFALLSLLYWSWKFPSAIWEVPCCTVVRVSMSPEAGQVFRSALLRRTLSFILIVHAALSPTTEDVVRYSVEYWSDNLKASKQAEPG
jgi:hypothetical protein